ncbi:hypothetical protein ACU6VJ_03635 [Sphaerotilus sulfidivorans]|nr:hypothetical protein CQA4T8M7_41140 [Sphaerotilus natans]
MNNRPNGPVWAKPCPDTLINRTAAAVTVLAPIIVPGCCIAARWAA